MTKRKPISFVVMGAPVGVKETKVKMSNAVAIDPRMNRYTCGTCGFEIVTIESVEGVTPMFLPCRRDDICRGRMVSSMYRDVEGEPSYEWRKPTVTEYRKLHPDVREHCDEGGLMLYPIEGKPMNDTLTATGTGVDRAAEALTVALAVVTTPVSALFDRHHMDALYEAANRCEEERRRMQERLAESLAQCKQDGLNALQNRAERRAAARAGR